MLDGFQYVLGQIGVVLVITAVLAAVLGWFLGRGSRRRHDEALERAVEALRRPGGDAAAFAPSQVTAGAESEDATPDTEGLREDPEFPTHRHPFGVPPIDHVPLDGDDAGTVIRPAPDGTVVRPSEATVLRPVGVPEVR